MAHRALTLKYRPQVFADMVGQDHVSSVLVRALESGRIAHAYLFTGARGVGKTTSARILAKALNCERRHAGVKKGADPCNACTPCTEITAGVSLDVAEIDGASNRGIADVQALREKVRFSPTGGKYRVVIIDEVHQLSNDAFAALLKTLEEPPPHLVFVFATTDPQKLPETIRSRTQRFDFARVPLRKVADRLLDIQKREAADPEGVRFTLTEGAALLIARKSEGSVRDAVSALDQVISAGEPGVDEELVRRVLGIADREAFFELAGAIVARDPKAALHALHRAFEKGLDARELAEGLAEHVRHLLILQVDPEAADLVAASADELKRLRAQCEGWSEADLMRLLRLASEASWPMRDSPQPLIHLEAAVLQMATLEPAETLAEILTRLETLEERLTGSPAPAPPTVARSGPGGGAPGRHAAPPRADASAPPVTARPASGPGTLGPGGRTPAGYGYAAPRWGAPVGSQSHAPAGSGPGTAPAAAHTAAGAVPGTAPAAPWATPPPVPRGADVAPRAIPPAAPPRGADVALGAAPAAVPAGATATLDEPVEFDEGLDLCWRTALGGINGRKRMLGAFLEESRFLGLARDGVLLAMDELHMAVVGEQENRALILEEVIRAFGRPLTLHCVLPVAVAPARRPGPDDVKPMIERAMEWFQGDVIERPARKTERNNG